MPISFSALLMTLRGQLRGGADADEIGVAQGVDQLGLAAATWGGNRCRYSRRCASASTAVGCTPSRRRILILLLSSELVGMVQQKFHKNGGVRRLQIIPGDCSDNPKPELPVQGNHAGIAFPAVGNNAIKSIIAGVGDLPGFEERAEALVLKFRKNSGGADIERASAVRGIAVVIVEVDVVSKAQQPILVPPTISQWDSQVCQ